jgi:ceramide glucosyltransferase
MDAAFMVHVEAVLSEWLAGLCFGGASLGCLYLLLAAIAVLRFGRDGTLRPNPAEAVTILKPLHGAEPGLWHRLWSFSNQAYAAPVQIVCGVRNATDAAAGSVDMLATHVPDVALVVDARQRGTNPKVSNLANMLHRASHDVLVMADSDIEVGRDFLNRMVAELQRPGVGAVSCLYHGVASNGFWARQSALAINAHFLPNVVLAIQLGLAEPCFGAAIAIRRGMLRRIGGFEAFADSLADDYEIGAAVRATGAEIAIPPFSIGHACFERSLRALFAHDLRAARTIKSIDPIGYCGALLTHPFPLALIALAAGDGKALWLAGLALGCRGVLCLSVEHAFTLSRQSYLHIPLRDVLSFAVYVWGLFGTAVNWRGAGYHVTWEGRLTADRERAEQ